MFRLGLLVALVFVSGIVRGDEGSTETYFFNQEGVQVAPPAKIEVREAADKFHHAVIQAAAKQVKEGKLKRTDLIRLRVRMLSPAFREHAEDLAVTQMAASGSENVPIGADGQIDRASIDWDALIAFLEKLLPLILQLIDAFSANDVGDVGLAA